ncbi:hypothetical protein PV328_007849 [Microctonus aethiopoides]|uniref:RRM domain-containing protein n=1 Tax=Microctonus aethiopoides TaxID=144406 RepID=A0AA39EZY5_9HYME|nr:hypothetical protein PV328_007849 [Microctonus aethiopoides]
MADMSLDDIIKKKKPTVKTTMKGRSGIGKGPSRGGIRSNVSPRGRGNSTITDARYKIIQKNRAKLTDARDKLAQIAKQSDARLKLDKIRASNVKKPIAPISNISRKTGKNGRILLTTNKIPPLITSRQRPTVNYNVQSTRTVGFRPPIHEQQQQLEVQQQQQQQHYIIDDMMMDYNNEPYINDAPPLRRTVSNEYAPIPPPPPPVFNMKAPTNYNWIKQTNNNAPRNLPIRKANIDRPRDFKVISRGSLTQKLEPSYRDDWSFGTKSRTIVNDELDDKYYETRVLREVGIKSRLDSGLSKPRTMGIMSRPKTSSSVQSSATLSQPTGYRIVVSNLQANVTQEDIKELFEDVGELLVSRLVRPGTAEVIYKTIKDATKAVETYHNRQLDGHPMKCLLVNPRPKNNPTAPAVRSKRAAGTSYVQPSLGAVHRALFDDCHN